MRQKAVVWNMVEFNFRSKLQEEEVNFGVKATLPFEKCVSV